MATLKFYLDTRHAKKDGTFPLKIKIAQKKEAKFVNLNVSLKTEQWDSMENKIINHKRKSMLNSYIKERMMEVENMVYSLMKEGKINSMDVTSIKNEIMGIPEEEEEQSTPDPVENVNSLKGSSLLNLVVKEPDKLSGKKADLSAVPSARYLLSGAGARGRNEAGAANDLFFHFQKRVNRFFLAALPAREQVSRSPDRIPREKQVVHTRDGVAVHGAPHIEIAETILARKLTGRAQNGADPGLVGKTRRSKIQHKLHPIPKTSETIPNTRSAISVIGSGAPFSAQERTDQPSFFAAYSPASRQACK